MQRALRKTRRSRPCTAWRARASAIYAVAGPSAGTEPRPLPAPCRSWRGSRPARRRRSQRAGSHQPAGREPGRQLTADCATRTCGQDAALAVQNSARHPGAASIDCGSPREGPRVKPRHRTGKGIQGEALAWRTAAPTVGRRRPGPARDRRIFRTGGANGRSGNLPASARPGNYRNRAGSSIQPQHRPTASVPAGS
jgi:hypothetical protein